MDLVSSGRTNAGRSGEDEAGDRRFWVLKTHPGPDPDRLGHRLDGLVLGYQSNGCGEFPPCSAAFTDSLSVEF